MTDRIGIVGVGRMGLAMARHLIKRFKEGKRIKTSNPPAWTGRKSSS